MLQNIIISKPTLMYKVLDKDMIKNEIVVHLPLPKRGFPPTVVAVAQPLFFRNNFQKHKNRPFLKRFKGGRFFSCSSKR